MGSFRNSTDSFEQLFPAQYLCFRQSLALNQFRDGGTAGHGGNTSFRAETDLGDAVSLQLERQLQYIATGRIFDLRRCVRIGDFSGVARVLEMIEKSGRVHRIIVSPPSRITMR